MDKDYLNFIERMGSFEDGIDLTEDNLGMYHGDKSKKDRNTIVTRNRSAVVNDELSHIGIKGMRWGHHKAVNANTISKTAQLGKDVTELGKTVNRGGFSKKSLNDAKKLSDDDLKKLTNRLNLENNYINAKAQQQGRDRVERILSTAGSTLAVASSAAILYNTIKKFN